MTTDRGSLRLSRNPLTYANLAREMGISKGYATMLMKTVTATDRNQCGYSGCSAFIFVHDPGQRADRFCADHPNGRPTVARLASDAKARAVKLAALRRRYPR
jgi:DNA-binding transcriptional regulator GbsR (MarR family)